MEQCKLTGAVENPALYMVICVLGENLCFFFCKYFMIYRTQILATLNCILFATQIVEFTTELRQEKSVGSVTVVLSTCVELSLDIDRGVIVETARSAGDVHIHTGHVWRMIFSLVQIFTLILHKHNFYLHF